MRTGLLFLLFFVLSCASQEHATHFQVAVAPFRIEGLPGLQSFAYGQTDGKWLLVGGRTDGLHRRQPWATFDMDGQNNRLYVVDPVACKCWSASLDDLPEAIREQMSSTNMEFHQEGDYLYLVGGYGYSKTADDHLTYPCLTAVNVPNTIQAVIAGKSLKDGFRQLKDEDLAVTGGSLNKIYDTYYLTGGQRFDGRYNPMGGPSYVQTYTNAIRRFKIVDDGTAFHLIHLAEISDTANLHRRDYNVIQQILPNGQEGLTAFSGVFQYEVDLPYMNCVNIDSTGFQVNNDFRQYYNHYHCAHIPLYSEKSGEMHNLFLGGIAQYFDSAGVLVQNNNVPFVKTIARVTRDKMGKMAEYKLPGEMPAYLGSSSEFIPLEKLPKYGNGVIKMDDLAAEATLIGYVIGGIDSPSANIFWENDGTQSHANSQLFKVLLVKNSTAEPDRLNPQSTGTLHLQVEAHIIAREFELTFNLKELCVPKLIIRDSNQKIAMEIELKNLHLGENKVISPFKALQNHENYFLTLETPSEKVTQKIVVEI